MLAAFGGLGIGLVWGWLAVRLVRGARPMLVARTLLWLVLQALLVRWLGAPAMLIWAGVGLLAGVMLVRGVEARARRAAL